MPSAVPRYSPPSEGSVTSPDHSPSTTSTLPTIPSDEDRSSEEDGPPPSSTTEKGRLITPPVSEAGLDTAKETATNGDKEAATNGHAHGTDSSKPRSRSGSQNVRRLSITDMQELAKSPESLPIAPAPDRRTPDQEHPSRFSDQREHTGRLVASQYLDLRQAESQYLSPTPADARTNGTSHKIWHARDIGRRPSPSPRTLSTPPASRTQASIDIPSTASSPRRYSFNPSSRPPPLSLNLDGLNGGDVQQNIKAGLPAVPTPQTKESPTLGQPPALPIKIPLPPMSLPTHLQLEIEAQRPSPLYIHHPHSSDVPYESHAVKIERLKNVLLLPTYLEGTLLFGALACLDAFLHTFTILPVKFVVALWVLVKWWAYVVFKEMKWLAWFVWDGLGRLKERGRTDPSQRLGRAMSDADRSRSCSTASEFSVDVDTAAGIRERHPQRHRDSHSSFNGHAKPSSRNTGPGPKTGIFRHKRTKSLPSALTAFHKADLLQGAVIICSSAALMTLDASRMYHFIRAQSAIKLYVIYNILEVGDRLLSSLGQDILECLFSTETLSRNSSGRSKVLLPLGMFVLALIYSCLHSIALYYQVITLNVAVNSYSNALLTLLLSNQFVEIKSTVFKRIEKDNLFQLTCADIVERFQLWIMLFIIGLRNVVEVGGLSIPGAGFEGDEDGVGGPVPLHNPSILPHSFTVLPSWIISGEVLSPFLIVMISEVLVDNIKHAYVTKFNNIKPNFYGRILDILCKDYYTNAFMTPSLTRRLGLAVIPLSCLFIRASVQTYHMFLSTHLPMPMPPSTQTSLTEESATPSSPAMIAALNRFDSLIRDSLGRATYGHPYGSPLNSRSWYSWTSDDIIATMTMIVFFFITFLVLLILKLLLGMALLKYSRNRYAQMKQMDSLVSAGKAERESYDATGRRTGGHGKVEVGEERQRWIHADKTEGLKGGKGPGGKRSAVEERNPTDNDYNGVLRYDMVAKRIW